MATSTVENYLKQLYLLNQQSPGELVSMGNLAAAMGVVPGTATTMVKALADSGLVAYEPRSGARLTRGGEQLALHVLRRHRLLEVFLVKVLNLDWSEVHVEADLLEHAVSDKVLERIDAFLGRPSVDPHGDPIPTAKGKLDESRLTSLEVCPLNRSVRIARIVDQEPAFLQFIERRGLTPGVGVRIEHRDADADAVTVRPQGKTPFALGLAVARKILVESA